jgi:folate-binding protein YgfZ
MSAPETTPLETLQAVQGARFAEHYGRRIAEDYGDPRREYEAVRGDVGALDVGYAGKASLTGRDRVKYLHNMISNDIKALAPGRGCHAAMLTHQGRMEADLYVYALEEELRLECGPAATERLLTQLRKFIIADQVTVEDRTAALALLSLQGPGAPTAMAATTGLALEGIAPLELRTVARTAGSWMVVRRDRSGAGGWDLWLPAQDAAEVWRRWTGEMGIPPVGHRALDWLRTEAGIPWYGADMDDTTLPMEVGLFDAISMTKGCYRGQEIVARVMHRGHLNRGLAGIVLESGEPPAHGASILAGGTSAGEVTSATFSPRLGRALALAVLKDDYRAPGTRVEVLTGEAAAAGEVVALPLA